MQVDVGLKFQVRGPTGKVDTLLVDAPSALVGTAGHCEVRLPVGAGAHEHLELIVVDGEVHLTTLGTATPPLLDGYPVVSGVWPRGTVLEIGETAMTVEPVDLRNNVKRRTPAWAGWLVPALGLVAVLARPSAATEDRPAPPAPPLFDAPVATCPSPNSPTLGAFAAERARIGYAKRERSPFSRTDGIEAVGLLETAAACYRTAGLPEDEAETTRVARQLRGRLDEEYHTRSVRLEHASKVNDAVAAKRELAVLLPLLSHREGKYIDWLKAMDRWATAEAAFQEREKRNLR